MDEKLQLEYFLSLNNSSVCEKTDSDFMMQDTSHNLMEYNHHNRPSMKLLSVKTQLFNLSL